MAGRPKSFDMEEAYEAFVDVFWTKGYQGTSIDDLQQAAGIKRGSFYASFGSKDDVFAEVLARYWDEATEAGLARLTEPLPPREAVARFILHVGEFMTRNIPRGCLLLSSSEGTACVSPDEGSIAVERMALLEGRILETLSKPDTGQTSDDAKNLTAFVMTSLLGLNAMARSGQDAGSILAAAKIAADCVTSGLH